MSKGWTEERRKAQAERIRQTKPWEKTTGPKTAKGKKASSMNALKHGRRSRQRIALEKSIHALLFFNREFVKQAGTLHAAQMELERLTNEIKEKSNEINEEVPPMPDPEQAKRKNEGHTNEHR